MIEFVWMLVIGCLATSLALWSSTKIKKKGLPNVLISIAVFWVVFIIGLFTAPS